MKNDYRFFIHFFLTVSNTEEKFQLFFQTELLRLMLHPNPKERLTTRGVRSRPPLAALQHDLSSIKREDHFILSGPVRSGSSSSVSSANSP